VETNTDRFSLVGSDTDPSPQISFRVRRALAERKVALTPEADEDRLGHSRRLETALMALFRDTRDEEVFAFLYERTREALYTWTVQMLGRCGQRTDPLEILQDTYVNVYRYAGGFREDRGSSFLGWARTIAANVVRRAHMRKSRFSLQALPVGLQEPEDERMGPAANAEEEEQRANLARAWSLLLLHYASAWQRLSERDRTALDMVEVRGMTYAEAGQALRVGRSNMKMIMFRARKRIRALILEAMQGGGVDLSAQEPAVNARMLA
jgi:RNA polymerase sigma-70 factor (ECF subfamily)